MHTDGGSPFSLLALSLFPPEGKGMKRRKGSQFGVPELGVRVQCGYKFAGE